MAEQLHSYKKIVLNKVTLLPHSRLYRLEPIGVGTPTVESLTSYIARLAYHHCLSVSNLFAFELSPYLSKPYLLNPEGKPKAGVLGSQLHHWRNLNGLGSTAESGVKVVEKLTLIENLCYLTMLPWRNVLSSNGILKKYIAWCPLCLSQWRQEGRELYQPLLWSLAAITICIYHRRRLKTVCPHCSSEMSALQSRTRPGYCSSCFGWLGVTPKAGLSYLPIDEGGVSVEVAVVDGIGKMLAAAPNLAFQPVKSSLARALQSCVNHYANGNASSFSRFLGLQKTAIIYWKTARALPRFATILDICQKIQVPILSLLTDTIEFDCKKMGVASADTMKGLKSPIDKKIIKLHLKDALRRVPPPSLGTLIKELGTDSAKHLFPSLWEEIRKRYIEYKKALKERRYELLLEAAEEYPPPSMLAIAKRSGFDRVVFRTEFPSLCKEISRKYLLHRSEDSKDRRSRLMHEIRRILVDLQQRNIYPSIKNIKEHMAIEVTVSMTFLTCIVHDVRKEFG